MHVEGSMRNNILKKLQETFTPHLLEVIDQSYLHKGHLAEEGETHFHVHIVSGAFLNIPMVMRHKMVYEVLSLELKNQVHALSIKAQTIDEYNQHKT